MILLGYIPITKLKCLLAGTRKDQAYRLFHYCMSYILKLLIEAGKEGVLMTCCYDTILRKVDQARGRNPR
ncbi:hypothetical protein JB92DRAFT_3274631 [Gautieria morchelliformis]|nr:hypothetical protein JB92DRAFT_3274631 [Gautieria morchelliformis]